MSAVVSFVEDTFETVVDVVEDTFEAVGDAVEDVGEVISDAVDTIGDTVQAVIDDPIPVLLSIAGQMVGIPAPLTMAAITAARGGDLEDIVLAAGTAYFAPQVGSAISSTVSSTFIEAGLSQTFSEVASTAISKGLVNGTVAELKGGSFEDGFAGGLTGGLVSAGVGEVASYVKDDVIQMAQDSGLDLRDATAVYNAGTRAVSSGVTAEITGRNDFATAFTNSAIGSGVDAGVRELNATIDEQFRTAATDWNEKEKESEPVEVSTTGAGIPDGIVNQVEVSDIGFLNDAYAGGSSDFDEKTGTYRSTGTDRPPESVESKFAVAPEAEKISDFEGQLQGPELGFGQKQGEVPLDFEGPLLGPVFNAEEPVAGNATEFASLLGEEEPESDDTLFANAPKAADEIAASDISILPEVKLAQAPQSETVYDFPDFIGPENPANDDVLFANALRKIDVPESVTDIAESLPTEVAPVASTEPVGGLNALVPAVDLDTSKPAVVSEAPLADNLLTAGLATEPTVEPIAGGLNAVAPTTPEEKMATSMGLKPTDFTKPMVASVGNLLRQTLTQKRRPAPRAPMTRPAGGLQAAGARPALRQPPPQRMDLSQLIPIQKAAPTQRATRVAPAQTLSRDAKLSPITDIATLTSLLKRAG